MSAEKKTTKNERVSSIYNAKEPNAKIHTEDTDANVTAAGRKTKGRLSRFMGVILAAAVAFGTFGAGVGMWLKNDTRTVYADDLVNTVPSDENYRPNVETYTKPSEDPSKQQSQGGISGYTEITGDTYVNSQTAATNIQQSTSTHSVRTFASGLPLSTVFIDTSKVGQKVEPEFKLLTTDPGIVTYKDTDSNGDTDFVVFYNPSTGVDTYNGKTMSKGNKAAEGGSIFTLDGDLYELTFKNAAILPNGERADLKITYSNAIIAIDERLSAAGYNSPYNGLITLTRGSSFSYGGTDNRYVGTGKNTPSQYTAFKNADGTDWTQAQRQAAMDATTGVTVAKYKYYDPLAASTSTSISDIIKTHPVGGTDTPAVGHIMDATYKIVDKYGVPVDADYTFIFAMAGINLDRDPYQATGANYSKGLWYVNDSNPEYHFFSESITLNNSSIASDYIYVRPNSTVVEPEDPSANETGRSYYHPQTINENGNTRFIGNSSSYVRYGGKNDPSNQQQGGNDKTYSTGFVTLAGAGNGMTLTAYGHGSQNATMNTQLFSAAQIWYRYTSSSGAHGKIQTTSEGNYGGRLDDGGRILEPDGAYDLDAQSPKKNRNTNVVTEGKTVTYTMTPDIGYKLRRVMIATEFDTEHTPTKYEEVKFDNESVNKMKKGDTVTWTTASGRDGILKYEEDGTYTFIFNHAEAHEGIHVDWEPTTADLYVAKRWQDENDKDGLRAVAYKNDATKPKFKLQYSTNNGGNWEDVTTNQSPIPSTSSAEIHPSRTIDEEIVPDGKVGSDYVDGVYYINNDQTGVHPFTWEYLPVYTYDSNGTADRIILYRIVEIPDPAITDYENAQYYDTQYFDLTSHKAKTVDGWLIYQDSTDSRLYAGKSDGQYYEVNAAGNIASTPASPQPLKEKLSTISSSDYYTVDKAIPYQSVEVKNEHEHFEVYVELTKRWNDEEIYKKTAPVNEYDRKDLKFILHGVNEAGKVVDLNGDNQGEDLVVEIKKDETDAKGIATATKRVGGQTVYSDGTTEYVLRDEDGDGTETYYTYTETDNGDGTFSYTYTEAAPQPDPASVTPDYTYKIDDYNYGALIEGLPTHYEGTKITYTMTEVDSDTGQALDAWIVTGGGQLSPVLNDKDELVGYTTSFVNTPMVDSTVNPLPLTINKKDKLTDSVLEGATFTVYSNYLANEKAGESETAKVGGYSPTVQIVMLRKKTVNITQ